MEYSIQVVAKMCGLSAHTIRAWERRHSAVVPARDEAGRRLYSKEHVKRLQTLSRLCQTGFTISKLAPMDDTSLEDLLESVDVAPVGVSGTLSALSFKDGHAHHHGHHEEKNHMSNSELESSLTGMILALRHYQLSILGHEFEKVIQGVGPRDLVHKVMTPLLEEVWRLSEAGSLSKAQKQTITTLMKFYVGPVAFGAGKPFQEGRPTMLIASPEGDPYELHIIQSALLAREWDYNVFYLGSNVPLSTLQDTLMAMKIDSICLGISPLINKTLNDQLSNYLRELVSFIPHHVKLMVGGPRLSLQGKIPWGQVFSYRSAEDLDALMSDFQSGIERVSLSASTIA